MKPHRTWLAAAVVVGAAICIVLFTLLGVWVVNFGQRQEETLDQVAVSVETLKRLEAEADKDRRDLAEILRFLAECTAPAPPAPTETDDGVHECYNDGQARTGEAVGKITDVIVAAVECHNSGAPDIVACVRASIGSP